MFYVNRHGRLWLEYRGDSQRDCYVECMHRGCAMKVDHGVGTPILNLKIGIVMYLKVAS